jgi:TetR/AcrR family transcriptional regulator, lmrAB and yxaGH operons repressor
MRESALLSAYLTRTPSQTRKYVLIGETGSAAISQSSLVNPPLGVLPAHTARQGPTGAIAPDSRAFGPVRVKDVARRRDSRAELVHTMARLLRDQGYTATGRAQLLAESGVSNGSLYHHFPGGMEELAEAALEASGAVVADALREALDAAPNAGEGVVRFLDRAAGAVAGELCAGCPIAPTALESPIISPRLRRVAARCFDEWETLIAARLSTDGWPDGSALEAGSATLALIEGALLLARVSGQPRHVDHAKRAALALLAAPPCGDF